MDGQGLVNGSGATPSPFETVIRDLVAKSGCTEREAGAVVGVVTAVADAIRELGSVPSGHLYANLCGHMSLRNYESVIGFLKRCGMVEESGHLLRWVKE